MPGDERRSQILQIAMRLFSEHGFRGTTTKEIAAAAGVSEAMVFRHFANKEELYSAILDHKSCNHGLENPFEHISEALEKKDDFAVFYGMALRALQEHQVDRQFMRLVLFSALENHELSRMFFASFVVRFYEFISSYIEKRQNDGAFREIEPKIVVRSFIGMIIHHSLNRTLWDTEEMLLKISNEDAARNFTEILLNGIKK